MLVTILLAAILNTQPDGYVLITAKGTLVEDGSFNVQEISAIREAYGPDVFWFRSSGRSYIIRDVAVLKQIDALFDPQRVLGDKQGASVRSRRRWGGNRPRSAGSRRSSDTLRHRRATKRRSGGCPRARRSSAANRRPSATSRTPSETNRKSSAARFARSSER